MAIKRLQTHGLSLAEIQARLLGLSEECLAELAQVPPEIERDTSASGIKPVAESTARAGASFWKASPAQPSHTASDAQEMRVALAPGVDLVLDAARPLDAYDLSALASAAAPLLKFLRARRLTAVDQPDEKKAPSPEETT